MYTSIKNHRCKLCPRKFSNGRALGGHMRSHMMNLPDTRPVSEETVSVSVSVSASSYEDIDEEGDGDGEKGVLSIRKSIKLDDLEDRESETESTRMNPTRRRSRRLRKPWILSSERCSFKGFGYGSDLNDGEQVSSVSEVTSEEEVAFCLMMLSRDTWSYHEREFGDIINFDDDITTMKRFRCETCDKVFKSYQALGGHMSSHKKTKVAASASPHTFHEVNNNNNNNDNDNNVNIDEEVKENQQQKKIHECPICLRVFKSGQALGGHKRSHGVGIMENNNYQPLDHDDYDGDDDHQSCKKKMKKKENIVIDLNLPAPVEDEETSQIAVSAVSYAHF